jgi:hypothetical protein
MWRATTVVKWPLSQDLFNYLAIKFSLFSPFWRCSRAEVEWNNKTEIEFVLGFYSRCVSYQERFMYTRNISYQERFIYTRNISYQERFMYTKNISYQKRFMYTRNISYQERFMYQEYFLPGAFYVQGTFPTRSVSYYDIFLPVVLPTRTFSYHEHFLPWAFPTRIGAFLLPWIFPTWSVSCTMTFSYQERVLPVVFSY